MRGYLRRAIEADANMLFIWANDEMVRQNSFSKEPILWSEHEKWFREILKNPDIAQYIYVCGGEEIGQARVIIGEGGVGEINYSICSRMRGMGHGNELLELLSDQVKVDFPKVKKLTGKVLVQNTSSQKAFVKAKYRETYCVFERNL